MSGRRYSGYRGRTAARSVFRGILWVLIVVLVLAVVGLTVGQRYLVYTDNGVRLELPFFHREETPPADHSVPVDLVELPGKDQPDPQPDPLPQPDPQPQPYVMRAVSMSMEELLSGSTAAVKALQANTVVLDMKGEDGALGYVSRLPLGQDVDAAQDRVSGLLAQLHQEDLRVVARVSCFRDHALGSSEQYALLTNSGYRWRYDDVGLYWTNPTHGTVRDYVAGVVGELAQLGFDEILLDNCTYPTQGELGWIRPGADYDRARLSEYIDDVLFRAQQAVEGTQAILSVRTTVPVLDGSDTRSGQSAQTLSRLSGRIWIEDSEETDLTSLLTQAGINGERVVTLTGAFGQEDGHQCLSCSD